MQLPDEWDQCQLLCDIHATLSCATEDELERLFGNKSDKLDLYHRYNRNNELSILWTHLHASAFLIMSFAIIEGKLGQKSWKKNKSLTQYQKDEFEVLYCIRNALVHTNGRLNNLDNRKCFNRVSDYERKMKEDMSWRSSLLIVKPYYDLKGDDIILKQSAFDHILSVMLRFIKTYAEQLE